MKTLEERFWSKVDRAGSRQPGMLSKCWVWVGAKSDKANPNSSGRFRIKHLMLSAHVASWMLSHGDPPKDMYVKHRCGNPRCVRPNHLLLARLQTLADRFWPKVDKCGPRQPHMISRCWVFTAARNHKGYGKIWDPDAPSESLAHRVSWRLENGSYPSPNMFVCHRCDNPSCVRPNHLFLGSNADNTADKVKKGRTPKGKDHWITRKPESVSRGETQPGAVLSAEAVRFIRAHKSDYTQKELGIMFSASQSTVSLVLLGKRWSHVK